MTCIVGLVSKNKVYLGGDSAGVAGLSITVRKDPKAFINGEFAMGFTSSFRMGQILQFKFNPPKIPKRMDLYEYMVKLFVEELRRALKEGGYTKIEGNRENGGTFLVGVRGRLFTINSDFQVGESVDPYDSVGCGDDLARGALFALQGVAMKPEEKVRRALEAAVYFSGGVRPPFNIVSV